MKIKGLYFKLNMEKERDKIIYNFFNTLEAPDSKVEALYNLILETTPRDEIDILKIVEI